MNDNANCFDKYHNLLCQCRLLYLAKQGGLEFLKQVVLLYALFNIGSRRYFGKDDVGRISNDLQLGFEQLDLFKSQEYLLFLHLQIRINTIMHP